MSTLLREEALEFSVLARLASGLPEYGIPVNEEANALVKVREAFPTPDERQQELDMTTCAFGFNIDDGGKLVELGSDLTEYAHTIIAWTFATEPRLGRKVAHAIKHIFRAGDASVPLLNFEAEGDPEIDRVRVLKAQVRHEVNQSPRPWDKYVWTTSLVVQDFFVP